MAFTEAQLVAQLDSIGTGRTITLKSFIQNPDGLRTSIYAVGVIAPYAGRSRWVDVLQSRTPAQAASDVQNGLTA